MTNLDARTRAAADGDRETTFRLLHLHTSPFSERVRWALDLARIAYTAETHVPGKAEAALLASTGQRQVPVLFIDGVPLPDSTAILDWIELHRPDVRLLPEDPAARAQVELYEALGNAVLAPEGRQLVIGRMLASRDARIVAAGRHFEAKYAYSEHSERRARAAVLRALAVLAARVAHHRYLVGEQFTRADLTVAAMLLDVVPPSEALFVCDPPFMRALMTDPEIASAAELAPVFAWRDRIYRDHRGGVVAPVARTTVGANATP